MSKLKLLAAGVVVGCWLAVCAFCFYLGLERGRVQLMRAAVKQYQLREKADEKATHLFGVDLCVANGGLRQQCVIDVRRLEEITPGQ